MYPFSTPTPPDAALSPLPPRLSLRSSHPSSPSPPTGTPRSDSGTSRWSAALMPEYLEAGVGGGVSEWGMGGYGDLLSHDPRGSIVSFSQVTQGHTANGARGDRQDSRDSRDSRVVLLDGGITLAGSDAPLLLHEIQRARSSSSHRLHRHLALWSGLLSVIIAGFSFWLLFEAIWALARNGGRGRDVVRWVEMALGLVNVSSCFLGIGWLQTRRPSLLSPFALFAALTVFVLHLGLAIANLVLVLMWDDELATRCTWGIDAAWDFTASGETCASGTSRNGWSLAAGIRILITVIIGVVWLKSLRSFFDSLPIATIIDPSLQPSTEVRHILSSDRVSFVPSASSANPPPLRDATTSPPPHGANYLPPMPIGTAHSAYFSESTTIYATSDFSTADTVGDGRGGGDGVGMWLGAQLWRGVGWMFGIEPYATVGRAEVADPEMGEMSVRSGAGQGRWGALTGREGGEDGRVYTPVDMDLAGEEVGSREGAMEDRGRRGERDAQGFRGLFDDVGRPRRNSPDSALSASVVDGGIRPLVPRLRPPSSQGKQPATRADPSAPENESDEDDLSAPSASPAPPSHRPLFSHRPSTSSTGSSGSTGGALVFVRMSDGRLVRKLSTIASEGTRRTASTSRAESSVWGGDEQILDEPGIVEARVAGEERVAGWRSVLEGAHVWGQGRA